MKRHRSVSALARGVVVLAAVSVTAGCAGGDTSETKTAVVGTEPAPVADGAPVALEGLTIEVRRDPGCGCCTSWVEYLRKHGAKVELSEDAERVAFRTQLGIGDDAASCHTAVVEGYAIEGHVPVGAIERLLEDRPDAAGLALPGMPAESPGMGGDTTDWEQLPVMLVANDGTLSTFDY